MPCVQIIENEFECLADKRGLGSYLTYSKKNIIRSLSTE